MKLVWPFTKRRRTRPSLPVHLRARYDAAQTTVENARHWAMADGLSADAAMTADVRRTLRNRSRYEVANNSYAKGMVLTVAGDCVGTGPRLQLLSEDNETNRIVEQTFADWAMVRLDRLEQDARRHGKLIWLLLGAGLTVVAGVLRTWIGG